MADAPPRPSSVNRRQPSRLQRRAPPPSSLQITRAADWNVAIPLLSPLVSPDDPIDAVSKSRDQHHQKEAMMPPPPPSRQHKGATEAEKSATAVVFQKWQHPAAPFCYETQSMVQPFCPV